MIKKIIIGILAICFIVPIAVSITAQTRIYMGSFIASGFVQSESYYVIKDVTAPATPPCGYGYLYVNSDTAYFIDDGGTATSIIAAAGAGGDFDNGGEAGGADRTLGNTDTYDLGFLVDGNDVLHIQSNGDVGINTTAADVLLQVQGDAGASGELKLSTAETAVIDGVVLGRIDFQAPLESSGTDSILIAASIWAEADDTFADDNNDTDLVFAAGLSETAAEKMRLDSSGGVTAASFTSNVADGLHYIAASNTTGRSVAGTAGDMNYDATADEWEISDGVDHDRYILTNEKPAVIDSTLDLGTVETFTASDTTPDVGTGIYFNTDTGTLTILDFDGASIVDGQIITVFSKGAVTYDVDGGLLRAGSTDIVTASGDITMWMYDGTDWVLIAYMDDSTDMGTDSNTAGAARNKTIYIEDPTAADDLNTLFVAPVALTITQIHCESDQTINFDLQIDDGTPADVNGSDIACTTFATDSSLAGDVTMAAGDRLDLVTTSVSGTPTWASISYDYTID